MVQSIDTEANHLGVARQSLINLPVVNQARALPKRAEADAQQTLLNDDPHRCSCDIACVRRSLRLNEKNVALLFRFWTVFDSFGDYEDFARVQNYVTMPHMNREPTFQYQKEIICIIVLVPAERTFHFDNHEIVAIELAHGSWFVLFRERCKLLGKIDGMHGASS